jgi:hypothetical protein
VLRAAARKVMQLSPGLRRSVQQRGARMVSRGAFDLASAKTSLAQSLAALGVARVQRILLHDPRGDDVLAPETLEWLRSLQDEGVIGQLGIGTGLAAALAIMRCQPEIADVVQVPHSVAVPATAAFRQAPNARVAYGVVGDAVSRYALQPDSGASVLVMAGCEPHDTNALAAIAISEAIDAGAERVLISTTDHRRLVGLGDRLEAIGTADHVRVYRELMKPVSGIHTA